VLSVEITLTHSVGSSAVRGERVEPRTASRDPV